MAGFAPFHVWPVLRCPPRLRPALTPLSHVESSRGILEHWFDIWLHPLFVPGDQDAIRELLRAAEALTTVHLPEGSGGGREIRTPKGLATRWISSS
jgi:hypothetical protein